ncbi:MAG TPA: DNA translocase FtsK 4TM domain-containing protein, partial [Terriglobales bacterium]|nr:DNA translocase FtsK 4TM domain-containing protein [Terriglobales bacterium]
MKIIVRAFVPTKNRRLNELVGLLLFAAAVLLFLALASYSPADPSLNTAASTLAARPARNWIGMAGALTSDLLLQTEGIAVFLLPVMLGFLGSRWFKSREITSPIAKTIGCATLLIFVPALLGLLPWHPRWLHAVPIEGLGGRILSDVLIRYFNVVGAYILCACVISVALYLTTAFSLSGARVWMETRFSFVFAAWSRFVDWREARAKARAQRQQEKQRNAKPLVTTQVVPARRPAPVVAAPVQMSYEKTGVERVAEEAASRAASTAGFMAARSMPQSAKPAQPSDWEVEVGKRADSDSKPKTTMPKIAGGFKLPASSLLHRPEEQQAVDENELKGLAQDLLDKFGEFDITGQITHINPGPVVTTYEFKPEAGIKYNRITGMAEDLCLGVRAESVLIERMPGKATVGIQVPNRERETIWLREVIESPEFIGCKSKLTLAMGKDIN